MCSRVVQLELNTVALWQAVIDVIPYFLPHALMLRFSLNSDDWEIKRRIAVRYVQQCL
ncbi:hypothetical protein BYT27DRAFT_7180253 [Phlegmacium glaucopus]|nr:hypothetical protein BYT27DRAFT_7180253 [Phlegmacium glaucopus]